MIRRFWRDIWEKLAAILLFQMWISGLSALWIRSVRWNGLRWVTWIIVMPFRRGEKPQSRQTNIAGTFPSDSMCADPNLNKSGWLQTKNTPGGYLVPSTSGQYVACATQAERSEVSAPHLQSGSLTRAGLDFDVMGWECQFEMKCAQPPPSSRARRRVLGLLLAAADGAAPSGRRQRRSGRFQWVYAAVSTTESMRHSRCCSPWIYSRHLANLSVFVSGVCILTHVHRKKENFLSTDRIPSALPGSRLFFCVCFSYQCPVTLGTSGHSENASLWKSNPFSDSGVPMIPHSPCPGLAMLSTIHGDTPERSTAFAVVWVGSGVGSIGEYSTVQSLQPNFMEVQQIRPILFPRASVASLVTQTPYGTGHWLAGANFEYHRPGNWGSARKDKKAVLNLPTVGATRPPWCRLCVLSPVGLPFGGFLYEYVGHPCPYAILGGLVTCTYGEYCPCRGRSQGQWVKRFSHWWRAVVFLTLASKFNIEPNGRILKSAQKTTARHSMWKPLNYSKHFCFWPSFSVSVSFTCVCEGPFVVWSQSRWVGVMRYACIIFLWS